MAGNIMRKFRINEISGVDDPCQTGARAAIFKRNEATDTETGEAAMADATLEKAQSDLAAAQATIEKNAADLKAATDGLAKAQADMADLQKRATLSDGTRDHLASLEKAGDKDKAKAFLDMDEADRKKEVAKAAAGDETCVVEGRTISKRGVGEDVFAILKAQSDKITAGAEAIAKAQEQTALATFEKRANDEFPHLAGTSADRATVLKYLDAAPEPIKKAAETILKAAEGAAKFAFDKAGRSGGDQPDDGSPEAALNKGATDLLKARPDLKTFEKAYDEFSRTPEGAKLYQQVVEK